MKGVEQDGKSKTNTPSGTRPFTHPIFTYSLIYSFPH